MQNRTNLLSNKTMGGLPYTKDISNKLLTELVKNVVSAYFGIGCDKIISNKSRKKDEIKSRQYLIYCIVKNTSISYTEIGKMFKKTHATILHTEKTLDGQYLLYPDVKTTINELQELVKEGAMLLCDDLGNVVDKKTISLFNASDVSSVTQNDNKTIYFSGYSEKEIKQILYLLDIKSDITHHTDKRNYFFSFN